MKKMQIILLVVVAIFVLAVNSFFTTEALGDIQKDLLDRVPDLVSSHTKNLFEPTTMERIERVIPIVIIGISIVIIVSIVMGHLNKIAKQQKEILENQRKGFENSLEKGKQPSHV